MMIDYYVPHDILFYCDHYTYHAERDSLKYIDCVHMHMGDYGNDTKELKRYRDEWLDKKQDCIHTPICTDHHRSCYTL